MGLSTWLRTLLGGAGDHDADAESMVQVANVRAYQIPIFEQVLDSSGIACSVVEEHSPATWEQMGRILVRRADADAAAEVLADFHNR